jgi:AP-3 complex subunit delta-1
MLRPKVTTLPGHIQAVYVQNVVKLYASILQQQEQAAEAEAAQEVTQLMVERLPQFVQSADLEVQERVRLAVGSQCLTLEEPLATLQVSVAASL